MKGDEKINERELGVGDFFGEISLLLKCYTTVEVTSIDYCTMPMMCPSIFGELIGEFPTVEKYLRKGLLKYRDY